MNTISYHSGWVNDKSLVNYTTIKQDKSIIDFI